MRWNTVLLATIVCVIAASAIPLDAQTATRPASWQDKLQGQLQVQLDALVKEHAIPGATLSIVLPDETSLDMASGLADRESNQKMVIDSRMLCGSTGKTFVSAIALKLIQNNKIKLNGLAIDYFQDPEDRKWLESLPNATTITVQSLMNHTSGLPRYLFQEAFLSELKANPMKSRTPREGLQSLAGSKALHPVGEGWSYSDSNYLLLGLIIEQVTGEKFYDLVQRELLVPLKLESTSPSNTRQLKGLVAGYIGDNNFFDLPVKTVEDGNYVMNPDFEWCGGGFVTTAHDLARWTHSLHTGKVLSADMHQKLVSAVGFRTGKSAKTGYGLGCFVWNTPHGLFWGHAGIMPGYLTQIEYSNAHGFAIALQTNTDQGLGQRHHAWVQAFAETVIDALPPGCP